LCIEAGDSQLKHHFEHGSKNASYQSLIVQNEIIDLCGATIKEQIVTRIKEACAYSILADEIADISRKNNCLLDYVSSMKRPTKSKKNF